MNVEVVVLLVGVLCLAGGAFFLHRDELSGWGVLLVTAFLLSLVFFGIGAASRRGCRLFAEANGLNHRFTMSTFCLVELEPGRWLDPELIRYSDGGLVIETDQR